MFKFKVILVVMLVFVTGLTHISFAQDGDSAESESICDVVIADVLDTVQTACDDLAAGQACYGAGTIAVNDMIDADSGFASSGDMIALDGVQALETRSETAETWGIAIIEIPLEGESVRLAVFGDTTIVNAVESPGESAISFDVENGVGYNINLREQPGTGYAIAGTFLWNGSGTADGRTSDAVWLHVEVEGTAAWVSAALVEVDGDINTLPVMDGTYTHPMQAFTLESVSQESELECGAGSSGVLVQYAGNNPAKLQVNGVDMTFRAATLLLQAQAGDEMQIQAIDGIVDLRMNGQTITINTDASVQITLGGESGLEPVAAPEIQRSYSFAAVEGAPIELVSSSAVCIAGVTENIDALAQPDSEAQVRRNLDPDSHYRVTGWADNDDGGRWWRVNDGQAISWIPQENVSTAGACQGILEVDPNAPVASSVSSGVNASSASSSGIVPVPEGRSIWSANSGNEYSTGTCNFPPVAMCQHLVAITPNGDGSVSWRGQEPQPYSLASSGDGFYSYGGRNHLGNANITMALTFNSESNWTMTFTQVFDNDPQCIRTFYYSASRQW